MSPLFDIICSGDVCAQTKSKNTASGFANVDEWAYNTTFYGHFELSQPTGCGNTFNSPTKTWVGGGAGYLFTNVYYPGSGGVGCGDVWNAIAWRHNSNGTYTDIGDFQFSI